MLKALLLLASGLLTACAPLLIGGAVGSSASIAHDRRSLGSFIDDNALELDLSAYLANRPQFASSHISITAYNGLVLLSGEVPHPHLAQEAEYLLLRRGGVRQIRNHLFIGRSSNLAERTHDSKQTAKIKTALLNGGLDPTRVKVVTERGISYLMGILTPAEAQAVSQQVSRVSQVRRVVTLFEIR